MACLAATSGRTVQACKEPWALPAGGCVDADAESPRPQHPEQASACGVCCVEPPLCILIESSPADRALPGGQGLGGGAGRGWAAPPPGRRAWGGCWGPPEVCGVLAALSGGGL